MRSATRWLVLPAIAAFLVISPSGFAQSFNYSEDFNGYGHGEKPVGWSTLNNTNPNNADLDPRVFTSDTEAWAACQPAPAPQNCSRLGAEGVQDYTAGWSGGGRFNLIHPVQDPGGRSAVAWYAGNGETGYPMHLQSSRMKASFDLSIRTGTASCDHPADGGVFAVAPVTDFGTDITRIGYGGGGMAWGGIGGFAIEFDIWDNGTGNPAIPPNDPPAPDADSHIGLDVFLYWKGGDQVASLRTMLDPPANVPTGSFPRFWTVGDKNQPIRVTVYYNDPAQGGLGVVRVYMKIDPAQAPAGTVDPISFGMDTGNPEGQVVLEACVGAWPTTESIFGFTGSTGGCNSVYQVDNVAVSTVTNPAGTACKPEGMVSFDPGAPVTLDKAGKVAGCIDATLGQPGWDVKTYSTVGIGFGLDQLRTAIGMAEAAGTFLGSATGEPDINYNDTGCDALFVPNRRFPGLPGTNDNSDFGMLAKGYICFPKAGKYVFQIESDDGIELIIGTGKTNQVVMAFNEGRGCGADIRTRREVTIEEAGVYPIQLLYFEGGGGAGIEFYRIVPATSLLMRGDNVLVGASAELDDQPIVYGLLNGKPAPDLVSTFPAPMVDVRVDQKLAGNATGDSGFRLKMVKAPNGIDMYRNRDDDGSTTARRFIDLMNDLTGGATAQTVNFRGLWWDGNTNQWQPQGDGLIPGGVTYPGQPDSTPVDQFGFRATGYAVFNEPGVYMLLINSDDDVVVQIGSQTVFSSNGGRSTQVAVRIPEAGTYPIRVEQVEGGGDDRIELGQMVPGVGLVALNSEQSTIKVYQDADTEFVWPTQAITIPANRKVADVGMGDALGWSAKLAKAPAGMVIERTGQGTALTENDLTSVTPRIGFAPQGTDTPNAINYTDFGPDGVLRGGGRFGDNVSVQVFDPAGTFIVPNTENEDFNLAADGYIEFPEAGLYGFSLNGDDGGTLWIGGQIVSVFPFPTGPEDQTPAVIRITEPGIYNVRAEIFERGGGYSAEMFQYLPDSNVVLVNSDSATVRVYRTLSQAPTSTKYANPVRVPASSRVGGLSDGRDPGFRVQVANATFVMGNGDGSWDRDTFRNLYQAQEMLSSVLGEALSINQSGALVYDGIHPEIQFPGGEADGKASGFGWIDPSSGEGKAPNQDDFAVRVSGHLALTAGGHIFQIASDDGFNFWIGGSNPQVDGYNVGQSGSLKGASTVMFYVQVSEEGLYPFVFEFLERGGGQELRFSEVFFDGGAWSTESVNGGLGRSARAFVSVASCSKPFADIDRDGDVDQEDFGAFQACFTGDMPNTPAPRACQCFDRDNGGQGDTDVDTQDLAEFVNCLTGPAIPWSQELAPNCQP